MNHNDVFTHNTSLWPAGWPLWEWAPEFVAFVIFLITFCVTGRECRRVEEAKVLAVLAKITWSNDSRHVGVSSGPGSGVNWEYEITDS